MREMQLIYASRPFGYDELTLTSILMQARKNNARNGITGALVCRDDLFLQILEGPRDLVTSTSHVSCAMSVMSMSSTFYRAKSIDAYFPNGPCGTIRLRAGCGPPKR